MSAAFFFVPAPSPMTYVGIILDVVILSFIFWFIIRLAERTEKTWIRFGSYCVLLVSALISVYSLKTEIRHTFDLHWISKTAFQTIFGSTLSTSIFSIIAFAMTVFILSQRERTILIIRWFALRGSLIVCLTFGWAFFSILTKNYHIPYETSAVPPPKTETPRIVWLMFDGLAQREAFENNYSEIKLTHLEAFRDQAFYASKMYSPSENTYLTMMSYLTGELAEQFLPKSRDEGNILTYQGDKFSTNSSRLLFSQVQALNLPVRVAGWSIPYCRVFKLSRSNCFTQPNSWVADYRYEADLIPNMLSFIKRLTQLSPTQADWHHLHYQNILKRALTQLSKKQAGLDLIHWPIPHSPWIYNHKTKTFEARHKQSDWAGMPDSFALADRTLAHVKKTMQKAGTWDESFILINGDHWFRHNNFPNGEDYNKPIDKRVTFLIKFPNQKETFNYPEQFNGVLLKDLLLKIFNQDLHTPNELAQWISERASRAVWPYDKGLKT